MTPQDMMDRFDKDIKTGAAFLDLEIMARTDRPGMEKAIREHKENIKAFLLQETQRAYAEGRVSGIASAIEVLQKSSECVPLEANKLP